MISTSPLTVLACSRASGPLGAVESESLTSRSELTSPLVELASMWSRVPGRIPTPHVAGDRLELDLALADRADPLVAGDGLRGQVGVSVVDREVSRDESRRDRAGDRAEADIAGDGLKPRFAVDRAATDVAARRLHPQPGDVVDGDVAGGGLHLDPAEPARAGDVGGRCGAVEVGAFGAANADADLGRAAERDPGRADAEALAAGADLDPDLVAVHLDRGPLDCLTGGVVVAERLELDRRPVCLDCFDRDRPGGVADTQPWLVREYQSHTRRDSLRRVGLTMRSSFEIR